jgi:Xaa-Pro dipeptidase
LKRMENLKQKAFKEGKFNGYLVFRNTNMMYLTGFSGASGLLIPEKGENTVYIYGVNYEHAKAYLPEFSVELVKRGENLMKKIANQAKTLKIKRLAVDALNIESWRVLAKTLRNEKMLKIDHRFFRELREVKDVEEIELMRKAAELTSEGMRIAHETLAAGKREYEVAAEIEYAMRKQGSEGTAFETIVASGVCSAFPHGGCSEKKIQEGDLIIVDLGATYKSYRSDMTRTFVVGTPSEKQKKLHQIVKKAQEKAFVAVKPNVKAADIDAGARKVIEKAGYGKYFVHCLGHGIGLDVHEPPTLSPDSKDVLAESNVVTVEPGVYFVGYGGVRIEDTVLVHKNGAEKLTNGSYKLS